MFNISRQYRHLQRYRKITEVLLKNGLGFIIDWLDLKKYLPYKDRFSKDEHEINKLNLPARIRQVLQELGPTYIKLGQLLSTRADILPPAYIKELRKLQDKVDSIPFARIETVLEEELGKEYMDVFSMVEKEHQASASIAQTYRARLLDGTNVILKIQRPEIEGIIKVDLEIIKNLIRSAEERGLIPDFLNALKIFNEFEESLKKELNFKREQANINKFKDNFKDKEDIIAPHVYEELSSRRILVLEEIKGLKLSEFAEDKRDDINGPYLAKLGAKALMKQVLIDGFFHADPHPGNIFIVDDTKLAYIDFGLMGRLTKEDQNNMSLLFIALLKQDIEIIVDLLLEVGYIDNTISKRKFKMEIEDLLNRYYGVKLANIDFMSVIDDIQRLLFNFRVRMPEEFFLLFRAIGVSEGVGFMLDTSFNLVETAQGFLKELLYNKLKPENILEGILHKIWDYRNYSKDLPKRLNQLLNVLLEDEFTIQFKHMNLDNLANRIDITSNRLSVSLIITALIIGSSMILQTNMKPMVFGIPLLGFLGYSVAGLMGLWLIISIFRSGKY